MRRISLRSTSMAGGATMKLAIDITGSWTTITTVRPTRDRKSRPAAMISMLSTELAAEAFHREQHDGNDDEPDDAGEIPLHVSLVDELPDQIGGERGAAGGDPHQAQRHGVAAPMLEPLLGQQPPHQGGCAVRVGKQGRELRLEHPPSTTAESPRIANAGPVPPGSVPCPSRADFSRGNQPACACLRASAMR